MDYIIQSGDTLALLARRFKVTLPQLLAANPQITNPNLIFAGQRIIIPNQETTPFTGADLYIIRPGDTLYQIAISYGIPLNRLIEANPQISDANRIAVGQRINIPLPPGTAKYTIRPGDTLYYLARRLNTTVLRLTRLNPNIDPNRLLPGQVITVPVPAPGCIVFVSGQRGNELRLNDTIGNTMQITNYTGTPAEPLTFEANTQWSPDGKYIAYLATGGLFIVDACGRNPVKLADRANDFSWSNNGSRIAYSNDQGTFIVTLQGQTTRLADNFFHPVWFPGDTRLAGSARNDRFDSLVTVEATGANYRVIETFQGASTMNAQRLKVSSDGRYIAAEIAEGPPVLNRNSIFIYDFLINTLYRAPGFNLIEDSNVVGNYSILGSWSPDSTRLVYSTQTGAAFEGDIRIITPQGRLLRSFPRSIMPIVSWSPFNDWLIISLSCCEPTISIFNIQTGQEIFITDVGSEYSPDWKATPCMPC